MPKIKCKICSKEFYLSEQEFVEGIENKNIFLCKSCNQMKEKASNAKLTLDCYLFLARRWSHILYLFETKSPPSEIYKHIREYWQFCRNFFYINFYVPPSMRHKDLNCEICPIDKGICGTHYYYQWKGRVRFFQDMQKITKKEFYATYNNYHDAIIEIIYIILENISKLISEYQFLLDKNDQQFLESLVVILKEIKKLKEKWKNVFSIWNSKEESEK